MFWFFLFTQKFNFSHYLLMLIESKPRFYSPQNKSVVAEDSPLIRDPSYIFANSIWALRASIVLDFIQAELC